MKNKILITGIAGFIGSKLAKKLILKGYKVVGIDNFITGYKQNVPKKCKFYYGDCSNLKDLKKIDYKNISTIYHIGGQSGGVISFDDPIKDMKYNVESTLNLLRLANQNKVKNFFYASSVAVYGQKKIYQKVNESDPCNPLSFYGLGKLTSEKYINLYKKFYNLNACSLRIFNTYGPGQDLKNYKQGMLSIYLAQALKSKKITVKGSLNRFRDFVHVDDVVNAFISLLNYKNHKCTYNVCYGKKTTVKKAIELIETNLPYKVKIKQFGHTPGDQYGIVGNCSLIKKKLKWKTQFSDIEKGLKNFVTSYIKKN